MTIGRPIEIGGFPRFGTVMNVISAPLNFMKTFNLIFPPAICNSDGYPTGTISAGVGSQGSAPSAYYDPLVLKWNGEVSNIGAVGTCAIIYSFANCTIPGMANNCVSGNLQFINTNPSVNPRIVFKHGSLITGVSGGNGSPVVLTMVNSPQNITVGITVKIQNGVSSDLLNGPNANGTWTVSAIGTNTCTLANSIGVVNPTVTGVGGPGVQSEVVCNVPGIAWSFGSGVTFSNFSNLVFCTLANEPLVDAGHQVDPLYISQLQALRPAWLRMMDVSGVQGNWETNFSVRRPTTYITWGFYINLAYYVGTITNSGGDAYTCSAPPVTNTGPYQHGETVQGLVNLTNSTGFPTINVNGRGAKPIMSRTSRFGFVIPVAASAGLTMSLTYTASWLPGSPLTETYVTQANATVSNAANNGSGKVRLTVNSTTGYVTGRLYLISGIVGTTEANNNGNLQTITVVNSTTIDLNINFVNAYVSGGIVSPEFGDDTVVNSSGVAANLAANFSTWMASQPGFNGYVVFGNSGGVYSETLTTQQGPITCSYTGGTGAPAVTVFTTPIGTFSTTNNCTLCYDYPLDAFLWKGGPYASSIPFEYYTELANAVGADVYYNWPLITTTAYVSGAVAFFRDNLNPERRLALEVANEVWNFGAEPWGYAVSYGFALGLATSAAYSNGASYSYCGARTKQWGATAISAWTTTRPRSQLYILVMSAEFDVAATNTYFLGGAYMGNATYLAYGGPDGISGSTNPASNYSAYPNRVGDFIDGFGVAPYWGSSFLSGDTGGSGYLTSTLTGTVAQNAPLFLAADKWRDGNFSGGSGAYDDLYTQFYTPISLGGPAGGLNLLKDYRNQVFPNIETILRRYDKSRIASQGQPISVIHYEAGPQFGLGNINNGTNSPTIDIPAVSNHLAVNIINGWDISAYTAFSTVAISSGTYNNSSGQITLTLASAVTIPTGVAINQLTGTGVNLANLNGGWFVNAAVTSSTTVVLKGPAGQGTDITITGGTLYLNAMDLATNLVGMVYNFKFSTQFYKLYMNYMTDVTKVHTGRECCGSQYGYAQTQWGILPNSWQSGTATAYSSFQAISDFNNGVVP